MIFIGIDPGLEGAIAYMDPTGNVLLTAPMPIIEAQKKRYMDTRKLAEALRRYNPDDIFVTIEKVIPMGGKREKMIDPKTKDTKEVFVGRGIASTAYFQQGYGELIGICVALQVSFITVAPQSWKKTVLEGLSWAGNKAASVLYVQQRWPKVSLLRTPRSRNPSDGLADAICLAEYGRREKQF